MKIEKNSSSLKDALDTYPPFQFINTGCSNAKHDVLNTYWAIKSALFSHKNKIGTFMRCGNLTYDPWI